MPIIEGKYKHYKNEDIDEYFTAIGVPFMGRKIISMTSPVMEISREGDTWEIRNTSLMFTLEAVFRLGEEYEENMPNQTIKTLTHEKSKTAGKRYFRRMKE